MGIRARIITGGLAVFAATAMVAVSGWACTVHSSLVTSVVAAAPDSVVQVSGTAQVPEGSVVDVRWGSLTGPKLATVVPHEGRFAAGITVPNVPNGVNYLVAMSGTERLATTPFQVTDSATPVANTNSAVASSPLEQPTDEGGRSSQQALVLAMVVGSTLVGAGVGTYALVRRTPARR